LAAFGGLFNTAPGTITIPIIGGTETVTFNDTYPSLDVTYSPANSITINTTGIYEINYFLNATANAAVLTTYAVRNGGAVIPETEVSSLLSVGTNFIYSGTTIVNLTAGSVLTMTVSALLGLTLTLADGTNASLIVKRLD